jgi:tRNA C32,U32 (ribose-2'-O)-methylase TrmJ
MSEKTTWGLLRASDDIWRAGVSHEALEYADQAVIIPQAPGFVDSFNVSVAAALALYEARTSRMRSKLAARA